jgi:hypothetical protein
MIEPAPDRPVSATAAWGVAILVCFGLCTLWVRDRWALAVFQCGFLCLGFAFLAWRAIRPYPITAHACLWPISGVVVWAGVQIALGLTVHPFTTWDVLAEFAVHLVAAWLMAQAVRSPAVRSALMSVWVWGAAILAAQGLLQWLSGDGRAFWLFDTGYESEVLGPFVYKNKFAQFAEMVVPIALYAALTGGLKTRVYLIPAAILFSAVVASGSRAGVALLAAEAFAILILCWMRGIVGGRKAAVLGAAAAISFVIWGTVAGWNLLFERILTLDPLSDHRWQVMSSGLAMARDHIWAGVGLGCWPLVYPAYATFDIGVVVNQAHCDWLQWIGEGGLPMLVLMGWLLAMLARNGCRSIHGIGIIFVMIHALIDYPFHQLPAFTTFVLVTAVLTGMEDGAEADSPGHNLS